MENAEEIVNSERIKFNDERHVRPKMALKNIEVGVEGALKKPEQAVSSRSRKKVEPNPMEYTFYVKKTGYRFYEPKGNIAS